MDIAQIAKSSEFLRFLMDNLCTAIFILNDKSQVVAINDAFSQIFKIEEQEAIAQLCGNALGCFFAVQENEQCGHTKNCANCPLRKIVQVCFEERDRVHQSYISRRFFINHIKIEKHLMVKTRYLSYQNQDLVFVLLDDITEIAEQKAELERMAHVDFLTALCNRRFFFELARPLYAIATRKNLTLALAMIDVDFFKKVNDQYGHDAGDVVLREVSEIMLENVRKTDIVARMGGEEFCILFSNISLESAMATMERIRKTIEARVFLYQETPISITVSSGLTLTLSDSVESMLHDADQLLYQAKNSGRNRVEYQMKEK